METPGYSAQNRGPTETALIAALLSFVCLLSNTTEVHAQVDSSPRLNKVQIPTSSDPERPTLLAGAALSPDGQQIATVYFDQVSQSHPTGIELSARLWNVGTQQSIASKQLTIIHGNDSIADGQLGNGFNPGPRNPPDSFVQYCNSGSGIMVADPRGTLFYLNPQTLEVFHATFTNVGIDKDPMNVFISQRVYCAANSPRAVFAVYGGRFGNGRYGNVLVRVYDLNSGAILREWDMAKSPYH